MRITRGLRGWAWPRWCLLAAVVWGLCACGFQLRGAHDWSFDALEIRSATGSALAAELGRALAGKVRVVQTGMSPKPGVDPLPMTFEFLEEQQEKVVVGANSSGQVRELELRLRVRFRVLAGNGQERIGPTEMALRRDISFNESAVLAKEAEEALLYRDMHADIVQQLVRRLAALR